MVRISNERRRSLLKQLLHGEQEPLDIAREHHLSAEQLTQWADDLETRRQIAALMRLSDVQAQMQIARYRLHAAAKLVRLAMSRDPDTSAEVARKACVDLLRFKLDQSVMPQPIKADDVTPEEESLLDDMQQLATFVRHGGA